MCLYKSSFFTMAKPNICCLTWYDHVDNNIYEDCRSLYQHMNINLNNNSFHDVVPWNAHSESSFCYRSWPQLRKSIPIILWTYALIIPNSLLGLIGVPLAVQLGYEYLITLLTGDHRISCYEIRFITASINVIRTTIANGGPLQLLALKAI